MASLFGNKRRSIDSLSACELIKNEARIRGSIVFIELIESPDALREMETTAWPLVVNFLLELLGDKWSFVSLQDYTCLCETDQQYYSFKLPVFRLNNTKIDFTLIPGCQGIKRGAVEYSFPAFLMATNPISNLQRMYLEAVDTENLDILSRDVRAFRDLGLNVGKRKNIEKLTRNLEFPSTKHTYENVVNLLRPWGLELPTPMMWIHAARGGLKNDRNRDSFMGYEMKREYVHASFYCSERNEVRLESAPIKINKSKPNAYGLRDMIGNVNEWVSGSRVIGGTYQSYASVLADFWSVPVEVRIAFDSTLNFIGYRPIKRLFC